MYLRGSVRALALATVGFFVVSACGGSTGGTGQMASADKQVLNVNDGTEPNSYDPSQQTYTYEAGVGRQVFETLLKSNAQGTDVEAAAACTQTYTVAFLQPLDGADPSHLISNTM